MSEAEDNTLHWYAARVKYRTEEKIKIFLQQRDHEIKCFIPFKKVLIERLGKRIYKEKPVIPCLVFVYADYHTALSLPTEIGLSMTYIRNLDTKQIQRIPDKQMQDFMFVLDLSEKGSFMLTDNLKKGDRVRVIKGVFSGVEGELVRIKGHKRVVIKLEGVCSLATTYIPMEFLERIG
ncbi:MAG: UpxY family transcription antiterminator [Candidatus Symbiothrix sp.]|jgi:transcription antitermination factor NusG|nr:UpxY family transcription antiterminator [Candidatus Symbiothrix sp.]